METKTMGAFISALRKASGMTQKDLAERLGVSDKSVSRWERDDGAPDLALIPVIAEVFGVTCDELLRGERRGPASPAAEDTPSPKAEKQKQRILAVGLARVRSHSLIVMGIAGAGLIAAMVCNLAFTRAWLGFLLALAFYLAAGICQGIFCSGAMPAVADDSIAPEAAGRYRRAVYAAAGRSLATICVLTAATLPLILFPHDPYLGLDLGAWLGYGLVFAGVTVLLCALLSAAVHGRLLRRGVYALSPEEDARRSRMLPLRRRYGGILAALWAATFVLHAVVSSFSAFDLAFLVRGRVFQDYASYAAFMEEDIPADAPYGYGAPSSAVAVEPETVWLDGEGRPISEEEALTDTLVNSRGEVLCTFIHRNDSVVGCRYDEDAQGSLLPIEVVTQSDLRAVQPLRTCLLAACIAAYAAEAGILLALYLHKARRA